MQDAHYEEAHFRYRHMCDHFRDRVAEFDPTLLEDIIAVGWPSLHLKHFTSRWGHYKVTKLYTRGGPFRARRATTQQHSITLSTRLFELGASRGCIDMVILHELCHMRYRSHGPRFRAYLERVCPKVKECEKELRELARKSSLSRTHTHSTTAG